MTPVELTELLGVVAALGSSIGVPLWLNSRRERSEARVLTGANDANLRDDQREYITELQLENRALRVEMKALRTEVDALRADLAAERRARQESEARVEAAGQAAERKARRAQTDP